MTIRVLLAAAGTAGAALAALTACSPLPDNNYHGTVSNTGAPPAMSTVSTPAVPAVPVTISGSGEQVKTADLVAGGYTVAYQATSHCVDAVPVHADGTEGGTVIGGCGEGDGVSGTAVYHATGRTTFHVQNTEGSWSLTFSPLQ